MNSLLLFPSEFVDENRVLLEGDRANMARLEHELSVGLEIAAARYNGRRGRAQVIKCEEGMIELKVRLNDEAPSRDNTQVIVAIPRPQTIKKVLQSAASFGLRAVHFVPSQACQSSYMQSKSLRPDFLNKEIQLGMQQVFDCNPPEVIVHKSFPNDLAAALKFESQALKLCAHTNKFFAESALANSMANFKLESSDAPLVIAIGPEAGWTNSEVQTFVTQGFRPVSLGERIYRVEVALNLLLGQIMLLRDSCKLEANSR